MPSEEEYDLVSISALNQYGALYHSSSNLLHGVPSKWPSFHTGRVPLSLLQLLLFPLLSHHFW